MKKKQGCNETRLIHGGMATEPGNENGTRSAAPTEWAMRALLDQVLDSSPAIDAKRADLIYRRVMARHRQNTDAKRRWIRRMGRTVISLMAAVAGSRAFRILTQ